jgi:penicillin-binding protein 2
MFERRLRIFLAIIFLGGLLLVSRAAQVQIIDSDEWLLEANASAERVTYLDAPRGELLDVKGRVIARDVPTFEACVNFRAIPTTPNATWLRQEANRRARKSTGWADADADGRELLISQQAQAIHNELDEMWTMLANVAGLEPEQINAARDAIVKGVSDKQRKFWDREYEKALKAFNSLAPAPWYERWIVGQRVKPKLEDFEKKVIRDEFDFHAILPDISQDVYNRLKLAQDHFPQYRSINGEYVSVLDLRPAVRRDYPFGEVAAQTIGRVRAVSGEDRKADPNSDDERRRYGLVDRVGGEGLEEMLEDRLRGMRGERRADRRGENVSVFEAERGESVRTTLDLELCRAIQDAFKRVEFHNPRPWPEKGTDPVAEYIPMNGAAVVIDVRTGEVRALVSVPSYDLNQFAKLYQALAVDDLNRPMTNRALLDAMEPGSTVKPIVGLAAVTQKLISATDTIECDGYAYVNGKRVDRPRCWTMSAFGISHHQTNSGPHPTGFLTLTDAIERSCNVYFVTEGSKLGLEWLAYWMKQFGYGRPTRIGLPEASGVVPNIARIKVGDRASETWYASIGQGPVLATPIQVANEMATIARDGIWMRPTLVPNQKPSSTTNPDGSLQADRVDLKLNGEGVRAVQKGMELVVNSPSGTGTNVNKDEQGHRAFDLLIAAKTGSATASPLSRQIRDEKGRAIRDENQELLHELVPIGSKETPNREVPWYRVSGYEEDGSPKLAHSWVGGFVPADNPKLAFVVYVEYGGSGGVGAASVVRAMIRKCIELKYLEEGAKPSTPVATNSMSE